MQNIQIWNPDNVYYSLQMQTWERHFLFQAFIVIQSQDKGQVWNVAMDDALEHVPEHWPHLSSGRGCV